MHTMNVMMSGRVTKDRVALARTIMCKFYFAPKYGIDSEFLSRLFNVSERQIRRILKEVKEESTQ